MFFKDNGVPPERLNREQLLELILSNNEWFRIYHPDLWRQHMSAVGFMRATDAHLCRILDLQRRSIKKISGRFKVPVPA